jgi:hypothetical protein
LFGRQNQAGYDLLLRNKTDGRMKTVRDTY